MKIKELFKISGIPVVIASLCCLSPVIILLAGFGTVSFASSLADNLYGNYKWYFRIAGLISLAIAIIIYLRKTKGICTIDQAKRRRNEIINVVATTLTIGIAGYFFFLYVVVHCIGVFLDIWK